MNISSKIRNIALWVMLTIVAVAYTGKSLHTHSDDYYDSFRATRSAATNGMSDDCPICHFNLLFFCFDYDSSFAFFTELLTVIEDFCTILRSNPAINFFSLRAPPVLL